MYKPELLLKKFLLLISVLCINHAFSQDVDLPNEPWGSAQNLQGKTLVVNCFISELDKPWTADEKKSILLKEKDGFDWIKLEAYSWKTAQPTFGVCNLGLEHDIVLSKVEGGKHPSTLMLNWSSTVLQAAGFANAKIFYDSLKNATKADNIALLIYAKQKGRSFANWCFSNNTNHLRFVESAVIYAIENDNKLLNTGTIIHEFLHLFGAWDMYEEGKKNSTKMHEKVQRILSRSIMIQSHQNLEILVVDAVTAWRIGWTKRYWDWYEIFRPVPIKPKT